MQSFAVLICAAAVALIFAGSVGLGYVEATTSDTTLAWDAPLRDGANSAATMAIVVGCLLFPLAALGYFGAEQEAPYLLLSFEALGVIITLILLAIGAMGLAAGQLDYVAQTLQPNCRALLQLSSEATLRSLAPGLGCSKYYDTARYAATHRNPPHLLVRRDTPRAACARRRIAGTFPMAAVQFTRPAKSPGAFPAPTSCTPGSTPTANAA